MGPDLANVGVRLPDAQWHLQHLFLPKSLVPGSTMPPYPFLFEERAIGARPAPDALKLTGAAAPAEGREVVPTDRARALVAYLKSMKSMVALFEAPLPPEPEDTNAVPAVPAAPINPGDFE
jgi:cytochrome c oxidase cbb3-type subunit 2